MTRRAMARAGGYPAAERVTSDEAQYALDLVRRICTEVGPGLPGSAQELRRAAVIQGELEAHLGAANVVTEQFDFAPRAFLGSLPASAVLVLSAAVLAAATGRFAAIPPWLTAGATLALSVLALLLVAFEFVLSFELADPLFPKGRSVNVIGSLRSSRPEDVRRLLILSGHHDSAPENTWLSLLGYGFLVFSVVWAIGLVTMVALSAVLLAGVVTGDAALARVGTLEWVLLCVLVAPSIVFALFFTRGWKGGGSVPGAADNLSASAATVALCRFLVQNPDCVPADAEVRFVSFGAEEAGLRGSRRYVARHLGELRRLDARLLNFETISHPEIGILTSDVNGFVKNSPEMVRSVVEAAARAGVPHKVKSAAGGVATDAGPFSRAGLEAAALLPFKLPQQMVDFYHQKGDRPEVLTIEPLLNVLKLSSEWVRGGGE